MTFMTDFSEFNIKWSSKNSLQLFINHFNKLIGLQRFDGKWDNIQNVLRAGGVSDIEKPNLEIENVNDSVYATIYALALLRKNAANKNETWELKKKLLII